MDKFGENEIKSHYSVIFSLYPYSPAKRRGKQTTDNKKYYFTVQGTGQYMVGVLFSPFTSELIL